MANEMLLSLFEQVWSDYMGQVFQDLRYAVRQLRRAPGFLVTAVLTLALGIGATTAIFTLVHAVLLKSLPVTKPNELYRIGDQSHCCDYGNYTQSGEFSIFSADLYHRFRDNTPAFTDLAAFQAGRATFSVRRADTSQAADPRNGQFVSGNFFQTFGVRAWMGRVLNDADDGEQALPVAVMSFQAWHDHYGSEVSVVGSAFQINGKPFTIVGVTPPGFFGAELRDGPPEFWMPLATEPALNGNISRLGVVDDHWLNIIGRGRPGADPKAIETQLRLELRQWQTSHLADMSRQDKEAIPKQKLYLTPGGGGVTGLREEYQESLHLLLAASGCVLLIACANLANLLLARGLKNRPQTSLRLALGASRTRLVRKAVVESLLLGLLGGAVGLVMAYAGTKVIVHLAFSGQSYVPIEAAPSWPVLLFALVVSLLTGIGFGVGPAWITSKADPAEALRGANRSTGSGMRWPQRALVVGQGAVSLLLMSVAIMLSQSLRHLEQQDFGFQTKDRYLISLDAMSAGYSPNKLQLLYDRLQQRLSRLPGVKKVAAAMYAPLSNGGWWTGVRLQGRPETQGNDEATWTRVTPDFFTTVGTRIVLGRQIDEHDTATSPKVAVVNETFARRFFKGENTLGKRIGRDEPSHAGDFEIVGVAADMHYVAYELQNPVVPMLFLPESQSVHFEKTNDENGEIASHYLSNFVLWAPGRPSGLEAQVHEAMQQIDPNLSLESFESYAEVLHHDLSQQALIAKLTLMFGALALALAAVGLYGVTAYIVEQRTGEIGVRIALGANRSAMLALVLRGAFLQVALGLAIGLPLAIATGRALTSQLYAVRSYDPVTLVVATLLLGVVAFAAAIIPARAAANVDPLRALRSE
jgi:predicted permease